MVERIVTVLNPLGIHARPSRSIVDITLKYKESNITLYHGNEKGDGKSIMEIMILALVENDEVRVVVDGGNENDILNNICNSLTAIYEYEDN